MGQNFSRIFGFSSSCSSHTYTICAFWYRAQKFSTYRNNINPVKNFIVENLHAGIFFIPRPPSSFTRADYHFYRFSISRAFLPLFVFNALFTIQIKTLDDDDKETIHYQWRKFSHFFFYNFQFHSFRHSTPRIVSIICICFFSLFNVERVESV